MSPTRPSSGAHRPSRTYEYGTVVELAQNTYMVVGRLLNPAQGEADVANAIVHRADDTLYVIDTGATPSFRPFLLDAIGKVGAFEHVVLINTHGHPDHCGNNDLVMGLEVSSREHYMSRDDDALADGYLTALIGAFEGVAGYIPGIDDPAGQAKALLDLFEPLEESVRTRQAIESRPETPVTIGKLNTTGWRFGEDDVVALETSAHTPGELIVYLPKVKLLHVSDELVSYYQAFPEADPDRAIKVFELMRQAASGDDVELLTDGHTFEIYREVEDHVQAYIDGYETYDKVVRELLAAAPDGLTVAELIEATGTAPEMKSAPGGPNPGGGFFGAMQALKKLKQLNAVSTGGDRATERFSLPS